MKKNALALLALLFLVSCAATTPAADIDYPAPVSAEVKDYNGRPTIHMNDKPCAPILYALTDVPGGRWSWEEIPRHNIKLFCEQGVKLFQLDVFLEHVWKEDGSFDLDIPKNQIRGILEVCPDAGVFFRFHLNAPRWWIKKHPEENVVYDNEEAVPDPDVCLTRILEADPRTPVRSSMASERWKKAATEKLAQFCREFSKTPEGNALIGMQVAYGVYGEWHQWGVLRFEADFSEPMQKYFRVWVKKKYETIEKLRAAWADDKITFEKISVPDTDARNDLSAGIFRHPVKDRRVVDYYSCQHELVADNIIHFARTVEKSWPRPIIKGTFYGYYFSVFNRQAAAGHLALRKILDSPHIDYLSGPQVYYPEDGNKPGEPYRSRGLIHSVLLNGKLWLDEYDQQPRRTWPFIATIDIRDKYEKTVAENVSMITRSMLFTLLKGQGLWFYDFGPAGMHINPRNRVNRQLGTHGYWDNPEYMKNIGKVIRIENKLLHEPFRSAADVLAVYDTESIMYMPSTKSKSCPVTEHAINWSTLALYYSGAAFDAIHIDDLDKVDLSQYKAVVFLNTFVMDEKKRRLIKDQVASNNRHLVWTYAPGYIKGNDIDLNLVSRLTGISLKTENYSETPEIIVDPKFAQAEPQKAKGPYHPIFVINDPFAKTLGKYKELDKPALGYREFDHWTSWYSGVPITDHRVFRAIFKKAGVNIFTHEKDVIYAGGGLLMVHTTKPGPREIKYKDKTYNLDFKTAPATKVIDLETGETVLE